MKSSRIKDLKLIFRDAEYSVYPILDQFVHINRKISNTNIQKLSKKIDILEREFILKVQNSKAKKETLENSKEIFINLRKRLKRIIEIAKIRDMVDYQRDVLNIINSLREFSFFTSAVNLGVVVYTFHFDSKNMLILLGSVGLFLYFFNDIVKLIKTINANSSKIIEKNIDEVDFKIIENVKVWDQIKGIQRTKEVENLESILISTEPESTLNYLQTIKLKHLYFHEIKRNYIQKVYNSDESKTTKEIFNQLNRFLENICQITVISLVAVDANRPLPKRGSIFSKYFSIEFLVKYIGYIMLNAITYSFFFSYFQENLSAIFILNILSLSVFFFIVVKLEDVIMRGIERKR